MADHDLIITHKDLFDAAPETTPSAIIDKLNAEINTALADPQFKARIIALGGAPLSLSSAEFRRLIAEDTAK